MTLTSVNQQWVSAAKGPYSMLGCVSRNIAIRARYLVLLLYTALVRLQLVYMPSCVFYIIRKTLNNWERAIRMVSVLENWMYKEGLKELGLPSLENRSLEGN